MSERSRRGDSEEIEESEPRKRMGRPFVRAGSGSFTCNRLEYLIDGGVSFACNQWSLTHNSASRSKETIAISFEGGGIKSAFSRDIF